jgi:YHS domain-containing protein
MSDEQEKIACHVCRKEIPKAAALTAEGEGYVLHFCDISCLDYWEKNKEKKDKNTPEN